MSDDQGESQNVADLDGIWKMFKKDSIEINGDRNVQCAICEEYVNYTSVSALRTHLDNQHSEYIKVMQLCEKPHKKQSSVWKHFTPTDVKFFAECNKCKNILSHKTTIGNLTSHLKRAHPKIYYSMKSERYETVNISDSEGEGQNTQKTWANNGM